MIIFTKSSNTKGPYEEAQLLVSYSAVIVANHVTTVSNESEGPNCDGSFLTAHIANYCEDPKSPRLICFFYLSIATAQLYFGLGSEFHFLFWHKILQSYFIQAKPESATMNLPSVKQHLRTFVFVNNLNRQYLIIL
jgi:hypothetical protein